MKKKLFFKLFIFAVIGAFVTVTSCKDYDDDISRIDDELSKTKTELASQLATLKTELGSTMDSKVKVVADDLAAAKSKLTTLEGNLATLQASAATKAEVDAVKAQIDAVKAEILEKTVSLVAFNEFKVVHETELATLVARITALEADAATKAELNSAKKALEDQIAALSEAAENYATKEALDDAVAALELVNDALSGKIQDLEENAATKAELAALQTEIATKLGTMQEELDAMGERVEVLETAYADLLAQHENDVQDLIEKIAELNADLNLRITSIETLLEIADGESGVLNKIADDLADQLEKIGANADAIELLRSDLEDGLADQLALIEANAAAIEAVAEDLQEKYDELVAVDEALQEQITQNANDIAALILRVEAIEEELPKIKQSVTDLETKLNTELGIVNGKILSAYRSLDRRVYGLTFIPDFTSPDGTPQIVVRGITEWKYNKPAKEGYHTPDWDSEWDENWSVLQKGKIYKGITILRYNVSPSNVKLSDFEIHALLHKTSLVRSADSKSAPIVLAGQATLANGVLSVPVMVEESDYDYEDGSWRRGYTRPRAISINDNDKWSSNVSVALQVKNINVEMDDDVNRYVTSTEYVKANFDLSEGRIALNEKSLKPDGTLLPVGIEYDAIAAAAYGSDIKLWNGKSQSGGMTDVLNHTINLNDYIYGVFDDHYDDWEKMTEFGFNNHTFKFKRVYLESEGVNQTNDYVTLNETTGVIGVKPDGNKVNQAAVGRTPIVEVTALVNGKVHAVGYIKIIITDGFDNSPVKFEFTLQDYVLGCNSTYKLTDVDIAEIDFDQVFNHSRIQLGKDAFFAEYKQGNLTAAQVIKLSPTPSAATVGVDATKHVWFKYAIDPQTQSVNLYNYLEGNIRNDAPVGTYKVKTILKSNGFRPDVEITWNFKVVLPTGISLTANTIYYKNGGIIVNPTIMEQGALTSTAYEALLNNTFMHESNSFVYTGLTEACQEYLTPYFVFTEVPTGFTISNDKKSVWKGSMKAAEIVQNGAAFYLRLETIGSNPPAGPWGNHSPFSDAAKQLVGKTVKVQPRAYINGQPLNVINLFDPFTAHFTYPLTLQFPDDAEVFDQANDGVKNSYTLNLYDPTVIKDWNGKLISVLTPEGRDLIAHYEIDFEREWIPGNWWVPGTGVYYSPFVLGEPQINLNPDGTIGDTYHPIPQGTDMKIVISQVEGDTYTNPLYGLLNTPASITLTWDNSATGAVQNEFKVRIPVSVKHKWSPDAEPLRNYLHITVKPGNGN